MIKKFRLFPDLFLTIAVVITNPVMAQQAPQGLPPAPVKVAPARITELAPTVMVPGTVYSRYDAELSSEVAGRVTWIADVGTHLAQGDPITRIDDVILKFQRQEAAALVQKERDRLKFLDREVGRLEQLSAQNNAAVSLYEQTVSSRDVTRSDLSIARAQLGQIEDQLSHTVVAAPFDGIVTERRRDLGERVSIGDVVARLVDPENLEIIARAPFSSVGHLYEGSQLGLENDSKKSRGTVRTLVPFGDARSHLMEIRIDVPASEWTVGEALRVTVPTAAPRAVLAVPRDALVFRRNGASLFKLSDTGTAVQVTVRAGLGDHTLIEVEGALSDGDLVVVRGAERLRDGQPVTVMNPGSANSAPEMADENL